MKSFNLEAAKRGEPICTTDGEIRHFVGQRLSGNLVVEVPDTKQIYTTSDEFLRMAPKKRTVWVNFYCTGESRYYDEEGNKYYLYQDGDLWGLCYERMTSKEKSNFGFEE